MATKTFKFLGPSHIGIYTYHFGVADASLLDFENANPLEMGEWLTLDSSQKLVRSANPGVPPGPYVMYAEKGRSDTQSLADAGVPVIFIGGFWAETKIFNAGAAPALGAALEVADVTYLTLTKSGLQTHAGGANPIIGYVTRTAANNNGWLQFQQVLV